MVLYKAQVSPNARREVTMIDRRPGLNRFLEEMNQMYEMHVYTMGTRSYADAICKAIDPEGKYFGTRILSRDESGSELRGDRTCCTR